MISIERYTDTLYGISSRQYSAALHREAKATPGLRWAPEHHAWVGYPDGVAACAKRLEAAGIILHGEAPEPPSIEPNGKWPKDMRDYQKIGAQFLVEHAATGALLADQMGLGKSQQALRAIGAIGRSALVVCPSFVRHVWLREAAKWLPKWPVTELYGTKPSEEELEELRHNTPTIFTIHYDIVHAWVAPILNFARPDIIVFDEAHALMSDRSRRSQACRELARKTPMRVGLSGTPLTSRPRDLWNVVDTLSENRFGKPFSFYLAFCDAHKVTVTTRQGDKVVWDTKGASNLDELNERLSYFMLRRTKTDVQLELPASTRQIIELEVPRSVRAPVGAALKSDRALRDALALAADGKIPKAIDLIVNHIETGSKVVCFSHRKHVAEVIASSLKPQGIDAKVITGDVPIKRRVEIIDEQPAVLAATMDALREGVDLSYADVAVFVELDYVPSKLAQCEARVVRFGQKRNTVLQYIVALSTADEIIREVLIDKLDMFEQSIGKLDDGLKSNLAGQTESGADTLRKLYEKLKTQEKDTARSTGQEVRPVDARAPSRTQPTRSTALARKVSLRSGKDRAPD